MSEVNSLTILGIRCCVGLYPQQSVKRPRAEKIAATHAAAEAAIRQRDFLAYSSWRCWLEADLQRKQSLPWRADSSDCVMNLFALHIRK